MSRLEQLADTFQSQVDDGQAFTLDDATLGTSGVDDLIKASPLGGSSITVDFDGSIPSPTNGVLKIDGGTVSMMDRKSLSAVASFRVADGTVVFSVRAALPDDWSLQQTFPVTAGTDLDHVKIADAAFIFTTEADSEDDAAAGALVRGLNLSGSAHPKSDGPFQPALELFETSVISSPITLQGPLQKTTEGVGFSLCMRLPGASASLGPVQLVDGFAGMALRYEKREETTYEQSGDDASETTDTVWVAKPAIEVGAHVKVAGKTFEIRSDVMSGGWVDLRLTADHGLASLSDLAALLGSPSGDTDWTAMLPKELKDLGGLALEEASVVAHLSSPVSVQSISATAGLNEWTVIDDHLKAKNLSATWTLTQPASKDRSWTIEAHASAALGSTDPWTFDLDVDLPDLNVTASLVHDDDRTYHVAGLAKTVLPESLPVPDDLVDIGVDSVYFTVNGASKNMSLYAAGLVDFHIYGDEHLAVEGLTFTFDYNHATKKPSGSLSGEIRFHHLAFDLSAEIGEDMRFEGHLPKKQPVNVSAFMKAVAGQEVTLPDAVPDFVVNALAFEANTAKKSVSFSGDVAAKWRVPLGAAKPAIDVAFKVDSSVDDGKRTYQGYVDGQLEIGQHFNVRYDFGPKVSTLTGTWKQSGDETIRYEDVGNALDVSTGAVVTPAGGMPDFGLVRADLIVDFQKPSVTLDAETDAFGGCTAFVVAGKQADSRALPAPALPSGELESDAGGKASAWAFVFGVVLHPGWTFSQLPDPLGPSLKAFDTVLSFKDASLVISTQAMTLDSSAVPALKDVSMDVVAGLNFGAHVDFSDSGKPGSSQAANLQHLLGGDALFVNGSIGTKLADTQLTATLQGGIDLPFAKANDGRAIRLGDPFVKLTATPSLSLGGHLRLPIPVQNRSEVHALTRGRPLQVHQLLYGNVPQAGTDATPHELAVRAAHALVATNEVDIVGAFVINTDAVDFRVDARFDGDVNHPVGFQGVRLTEIGVDFGIEYGSETPGFQIGVLAKLEVVKPGDPSPRYTSDVQFTFILNINPETYINPEYLYVKIEKMDLDVIFAAFVPEVTLPKAVGSGIQFDDAFVYWCDVPNLTLPDGSTAQIGFGFHGEVKVFDIFDGIAGVMITKTEMHGDFEMTPLAIKIDGRTILGVTGKTPSGGPKVAFNTKSSPYLDVTADVVLLGLEEALDVYLGNDRFTFGYEYKLIGEADLKLDASVKKKTGVQASGSANVNLDLNLDAVTAQNDDSVTVIPKSNVASDSAGFDVALDVALPSTASISGGLDFNWHSIHFNPHFTLTLQEIGHDLKNLWDAVVTWIENHVREFFEAVLNDIEKYVKLLKNAFSDFAKDVGKVVEALIHEFEADAEMIAHALVELGHEFEAVIQALVHYLKIGFEKAVEIAKQFFGALCSATQAFDVVESSNRSTSAAQVRARLAQTEGGQPLLYHYYLHEDELNRLLRGHNPAPEHRLRAAVAASSDTASDGAASGDAVVRYVLSALDAVYPDASDDLRTSIETVRPLLEPHRDKTLDEFIESLSGKR